MLRQVDALRRGVDVVVGTPGRIMDLIQRGDLDLSQVKFATLDEADDMLRVGYAIMCRHALLADAAAVCALLFVA